MKPKALMVTPTLGEKEACGVGQYGKHWSSALANAEDFEFDVLFTDSLDEAVRKIYDTSPDIVFYMWNPIASAWMNNPIFKQVFPNIKHVNISVDSIARQEMIDNFSPERHNGGYEYLLVCNPTLVGNDRVFVSTRLLPPTPNVPEYKSDIPIIGYHGFALGYKGIHRLAAVVNQEFDECIFRLHMPQSWFMDHNGHETIQRKNEISNIIRKPGIRVEYTHHMMDPQDMVNWLSQNTINCYFYDHFDHAALASSTEYALAARRPIAVSRSNYFKDFLNCNPSVIINEPYSLKEIIANGIEPLKHLHESYTEENFIKHWSDAVKHFLSL